MIAFSTVKTSKVQLKLQSPGGTCSLFPSISPIKVNALEGATMLPPRVIKLHWACNFSVTKLAYPFPKIGNQEMIS